MVFIENATGQLLFVMTSLTVFCFLSCGIIWYIITQQAVKYNIHSHQLYLLFEYSLVIFVQRQKDKKIASLEAIANLEHQQAMAMQQQLEARDVPI